MATNDDDDKSKLMNFLWPAFLLLIWAAISPTFDEQLDNLHIKLNLKKCSLIQQQHMNVLEYGYDTIQWDWISSVNTSRQSLRIHRSSRTLFKHERR